MSRKIVNDRSLFTHEELSQHRTEERDHILTAKSGNAEPVFAFWEIKRKVFQERAIARQLGLL